MASGSEPQASLGRVLKDGVPVGTCFQVSPGVLATAWHVVDEAGAPSVGATVTIDALVGGSNQQATVVAVDSLHDLAVLSCREPLSESVQNLASTDTVLPGTAIAITGVVIIQGEDFRYSSATGSWEGPTSRSGSSLGRATSSGIARGMGGAPVRRANDGVVIGVVSSRYNSADGWLRDTLWIARIEDLQPLLAGTESTPKVAVNEDAAFLGDSRPEFTVVRELRLSTAVAAVALHSAADRTLLLAGSEGSAVTLWDLAAPEPGDMLGHAGPVWGVAIGVVADRPVGVSVGQDTTVRAWDLTVTREMSSPLLGHTAPINAVAVGYQAGRAVALSSSDDHTIRLWDLARLTAIGEPLTGHTGWVNGIAAVSGEDLGLIAVSGGSDNTVRVWDVTTSTELLRLEGHTDSVSSVAAISSENGLIIVSGSNDQSVRVWNQEGESTRILIGHKGRVRSVVLGLLGKGICAVSGGDDGTVRVWPLADQQNSAVVLNGHDGPVRAVTTGLVAGEPAIVSAGEDGLVKIWQMADSGRTDHVEWLSDAPATVDLLGRLPLAQALAARLRRIHQEQPHTSFLVHLDGPWGSGKSTLLGFLRASLGRDWVAVDFNAWRESAVGPPWWALLAALRRDVVRNQGWWARTRLRVAEGWTRIRRSGAPFVLAMIVVVVASLGMIVLIGPSKLSLENAGNVAKAASAVITAIGTIWAGSLVASRILLWNSARGARLFEQSGGDPMQSIADHFIWLIGRTKRPVVFFVDDLDRCPQKYVVDLLEVIQTLVRHSPQHEGAELRGQHAACFVVAADGAWVRRSFEVTYDHFADSVAEPGKSLGYLFLDKLFQLRVPMPAIDPVRQRAYLGELLRVMAATASVQSIAAEESKVRDALRRSSSEAQIVATLRKASPIVRDRVAAAAVGRLTEAEVANATEHSLQRFGVLLAPNARSMKRFVNMYSVLRAVRTLEGSAVESGALALWTVIETRWPSLADFLRTTPDAVAWIGSASNHEDDVPKELVRLLDSRVLKEVLQFDPGIRFTPELIRACCGGGARLDQEIRHASST